MFTKIKMAFGRLLRHKVSKNSKKEIQSFFTYPSLNQISLFDWFDVLESGDVTKLNTTPDHFEKLYDEYFESIDNKSSKHYINENFKKVKLANKINILVKSYETLTFIYNHATKLESAVELEKTLIQTINILHPKAKIIGTIENKLKVVEQLITINTNEFKKIEVKESKGEKPNFVKQVVDVGLALNIKINQKETTVAEFIELYKQALKSSENGKR